MAGHRDVLALLRQDKELKYGFDELDDDDLGLREEAGMSYEPEDVRDARERESGVPGAAYVVDGQGADRYLSPQEQEILLSKALSEPAQFEQEFGLSTQALLQMLGRG